MKKKNESLDEQVERSVISSIISAAFLIGIYTIGASVGSFISTRNAIKSNSYFDKKLYEDMLRRDMTINGSLKEVFIDAAFKTFYEFPGRPGRNLAHYIYNK